MRKEVQTRPSEGTIRPAKVAEMKAKIEAKTADMSYKLDVALDRFIERYFGFVK